MLSPTAFGTSVDNEMMVMDIEQGKYLVLNDVANDIWKILSEARKGVTIGALIEQLDASYSGKNEVIGSDTKAFLIDLYNRKLIIKA
jgi:hypothetical protein